MRRVTNINYNLPLSNIFFYSYRESQLALAEEKMKMKRLLRDQKNKPAAIVKEETKTSAPVLVWKSERKR